MYPAHVPTWVGLTIKPSTIMDRERWPNNENKAGYFTLDLFDSFSSGISLKRFHFLFFDYFVLSILLLYSSPSDVFMYVIHGIFVHVLKEKSKPSYEQVFRISKEK